MANLTEVLLTLSTHTEEERESGWSRGWRYGKYAWTVIRNVIYVWLIYLAFEKMKSTFETLILAVLILILQAVGNSLTLLLRTNIEEAHVHRSLFLGLYKKFNDPEVEESQQNLRKVIKDYEKGNVFWYINSAASYVAYLYVLWKILSVVVL